MSRRAPRTLRTRLVLAVVGLLAAASVVIGAVSVLALQGILMQRLDAQLTQATSRSQGGFGGVDPGQLGSPADILREQVQRIVSRQGPGTVIAIVSGNTIAAAAVKDQTGGLQPLSATDVEPLLGALASNDPITVSLSDGLGDYRVAVAQLSGGVQIVTGLPLGDVQAVLLRLAGVIAGVTIIGLVLAAIAGIVIVRLALRPLQRVVATATDVAELPLDRGEVALAVRVPESDSDPGTEVGQVGAAINRMLGHVAVALTARQASENKLRQFVADASHELRTPLASIRGYAELTRRGNHDLPDDVVHSIGRVESEAIRMTSLVEDLLLLARLDEGGDLDRATLDLSRLLIDTVSDAHAAGPDHDWSLDLPDEPVVIEGDLARLHQVIANLLANARVHTPAGTSVVVALAVEGDGAVEGDNAVVTVTDDGPGIPEELKPVLFERFVRGDGSRSRTAGSTGLGLAIVSAVIESHHGTVSVQSEPGSTTFRLELPLAGSAVEPADSSAN